MKRRLLAGLLSLVMALSLLPVSVLAAEADYEPAVEFAGIGIRNKLTVSVYYEDDWFYLAVQEATNSHDYKHKAGSYEAWTGMNSDPDWSRYEN